MERGVFGFEVVGELGEVFVELLKLGTAFGFQLGFGLFGLGFEFGEFGKAGFAGGDVLRESGELLLGGRGVRAPLR